MGFHIYSLFTLHSSKLDPFSPAKKKEATPNFPTPRSFDNDNVTDADLHLPTRCGTLSNSQPLKLHWCDILSPSWSVTIQSSKDYETTPHL